MIVPLAMVASLVASFDCQLEAPRAIGFDGPTVTASEVGLPPVTLSFGISIRSGNPMQATVDWAANPMQMAGEFPVIATAPESYAFSTYSPGPCLFTEQGCLSQFNLVEAPGGKASLIVTPVALATDAADGSRSPFAVIARGQCTQTDPKK